MLIVFFKKIDINLKLDYVCLGSLVKIDKVIYFISFLIGVVDINKIFYFCVVFNLLMG